MQMQIVLAFALMFSLFDVNSICAWAQSPNATTPSPWDYPADIRAPTDEEYQGLRECFSQARDYRRAQNWSAATPLFRENLAIEHHTYGPEHPVTGMAMFALAANLEADRQYGEAEELLIGAIRIAQTWLPEGDAWYALAYNTLGMCQGVNGKRALAEASFHRAIEIAQASGDARAERIARANLADMRRFYQQNQE